MGISVGKAIVKSNMEVSQKAKKIYYMIQQEIPLLSIYPEKAKIQNGACAHTFIAALFTIAKTWKPSTVHR